MQAAKYQKNKIKGWKRAWKSRYEGLLHHCLDIQELLKPYDLSFTGLSKKGCIPPRLHQNQSQRQSIIRITSQYHAHYKYCVRKKQQWQFLRLGNVLTFSLFFLDHKKIRKCAPYKRRSPSSTSATRFTVQDKRPSSFVPCLHFAFFPASLNAFFFKKKLYTVVFTLFHAIRREVNNKKKVAIFSQKKSF